MEVVLIRTGTKIIIKARVGGVTKVIRTIRIMVGGIVRITFHSPE